MLFLYLQSEGCHSIRHDRFPWRFVLSNSCRSAQNAIIVVTATISRHESRVVFHFNTYSHLEETGSVAFIQLNSELYPVVSKMLTGLESSFAPSPLSILEGTIDGKVFVNRAHVPTCAAVMSNNLVGGRLIGRADDLEFNRDFVSLMSQRFSSDQGAEHRLYWSTVSETWDEVVFRIFGY